MRLQKFYLARQRSLSKEHKKSQGSPCAPLAPPARAGEPYQGRCVADVLMT